MDGHSTGTAPNFVNACVVMFGVNVTWVFFAIWAVWGLIYVMLLGVVINHVMTRLQLRALAKAAEDRRAPKARCRW